MLHIRKLYFILQSDKLHVGITPKSAGIRHVYMSLTQKEVPAGAEPLRFCLQEALLIVNTYF